MNRPAVRAPPPHNQFRSSVGRLPEQLLSIIEIKCECFIRGLHVNNDKIGCGPKTFLIFGAEFGCESRGYTDDGIVQPLPGSGPGSGMSGWHASLGYSAYHCP